MSVSLQITLNCIAFVGNLIELKEINTVLVLHDRTTRDPINKIIENLASRNDVAWLLANEFDNQEYWNRTIIKDQNMLILTALHTKNIIPLFERLYKDDVNIFSPLKKRSKNLIVLSDISKMGEKLLSSLLRRKINAVLVDWTSDEVVIYAWNPYSTKSLVVLNETEFLHAANGLTRGKYAGLFFEQLQDMQGHSTEVLAWYDSMNVYNAISKDSVASIAGTDIELIDLIGKAIQSPMVYLPVNPSALYNDINMKQFYDYLERNHRTYTSIQRRRIDTNKSRLIQRFLAPENCISTSMLSIFDYGPSPAVYPYSFENFAIIVKYDMIKTTSTALRRILDSTLIYLWLLFIVLFVVLRCGLQWIYSTETTDSATKRRRCIYMCQDTVQLSCGVVTHAELFTSHRYRHALLAHGATIIPVIAGVFITSILYGDFMMQSEVPSIDTIKQLQDSNLTVFAPVFYSWNKKFNVLENNLIKISNNEMFAMIWSRNTSCAYIIAERYISMLDEDHWQSNGRPLFHVVKERYGGKYVSILAHNWFTYARINTIAMRCQEHGLVKYFESVSKRTRRQVATEMRTSNSKSIVATAGTLEEILIACVIYLVGISFGIVVLILEYFSKWISG